MSAALNASPYLWNGQPRRMPFNARYTGINRISIRVIQTTNLLKLTFAMAR